MADLRLVFAGGDYDRTRALADATIRPEGIDLVYLPLVPEEIFWRMLQYQDFDVSELSMSAFITLTARHECPFVAIPAFLSRTFRHGCIFLNADAGIQAPGDLKGKRIGVPDYHMTAALWIRGMLQHEYGVAASDAEWYQGGLQEPGRKERVELHLPSHIHLQEIGPEQTLDAMLVAGEIDAVIGARMPLSFVHGHPKVRRLFPDYKAAERAYFEKTRLFPIMHCVALKRALYEQHPWVAQNLMKALDASKRLAVELAYDFNALRYTLPWLIPDLEETVRVMGADPWPYGIDANRPALEAMCQYAQEQGLTERRVTVDELFAPNTHHSFAV
jgi:4,5-dihydroxyphthalate decarboxylase